MATNGSSILSTQFATVTSTGDVTVPTVVPASAQPKVNITVSTIAELSQFLTATGLEFSTLAMSESSVDPTATSKGADPTKSLAGLPSAIVAVPALNVQPATLQDQGFTPISVLFQPELSYEFVLQNQETQAQIWQFGPYMISTALNISSEWTFW